MKTICFASSKGGVGKSTLTAALAGAYAARDQRVLIFDLDANQTIINWLKAAPQPGISARIATGDSIVSDIDAEADAGQYDIILIDVAGVYERALQKAMFKSDLVIVPCKPSAPDFTEAFKVIRDLMEMCKAFNTTIPYRVLINEYSGLNLPTQRHAVSEIARLKLRRFDRVVYNRPTYIRMFMEGSPPHLANQANESNQKAAAELDELIAEIDAATQGEHQRRASA